MSIWCCLLQVPPGGGHRHHLSICLLSGVWKGNRKTVPVKNIVCSISTMNNKATSWFPLLWVLRAAGDCSPNVRPHFQSAGQLIAFLCLRYGCEALRALKCLLNFIITVAKATSGSRSVLYQPEWVHRDKCGLLCHSKVQLPLLETEVRPKEYPQKSVTF